MKRLVFLVLALLLLGVILPAAAQSSPDLEALAAYYPQTTPLYVSFRTDDALIDELDAVRAHFAAALPAGAMDDTTLREALDNFGPLTGDNGTFSAAVRPWLGDMAAFGALSLDSLMGKSGGPFVITISITDRAQAQAFFENLAPADAMQIDETGAYTLMSPTNSNEPAAVYIDDQVLILTNKPEALPIRGMPSPSLADNTQFQSSLAALPEPAYSLVSYVDYSALLQASMSEMQSHGSGDAAMANMLDPMLNAIGGLGVGLTILNDRSLTADFSIGLDMAAMGSALPVDLSALPAFDPAFAAHLTAGTQLAIQGADLATSVEQSMASFDAMSEMWTDEHGTQNGNPMAGLNLAFRAMTGLDLEDDVLSWMTGQYAAGMSFDFQTMLNSESADALPRALQFAFVVENTTGEGAQALVAGLSDGLTQLASMGRRDTVTITGETAGGAPAILVSVESRGMREPFEILIGGNESVFVIGTPAMARAALAPDGGLDTDAGYQEAAAVALPNSPVLFYGSGDLLNTIFEMGVLGRSMPIYSQDFEVGPVFSSASMSAVYSGSAATTRMALTLSGE